MFSLHIECSFLIQVSKTTQKKKVMVRQQNMAMPIIKRFLFPVKMFEFQMNSQMVSTVCLFFGCESPIEYQRYISLIC